MKLAHSDTPIDGFKILSLLGEGESAYIYKVSKANNSYALKISKYQDPSGITLQKFRTEAAILQQAAHPSVVSALQVGIWNGCPFTIMELIDSDLLGKTITNRRLNEDEALTLFCELATALHSVHRLGIVHRDIHPDNIFWDSAKQSAKVIDFGLSAAESVEAQSQTVGTILYFSPEQTGGIQRAVDRRSDLYSLGAVLFHCLSGNPPFPGNDVAQIISQHINVVPPLINTIQQSISEKTAIVIAKLLQKDPDDRYQNAKELLIDLEAALSSLRGSEFKCSSRPKPQLVIGREREIELLKDAYMRAHNGSGTVVLIEGAPGAGKSRLALDAVVGSQAQSFLSLSGKCVSGSLLELFRQLFNDLAAKGLQDSNLKKAMKPFVERNAESLSAVCPGLLKICDINIRRSDTQEVSFEDIADLFRDLCVYTPVIVYIDDIQWIDEASRAILLQLLPGVRDQQILFLITGRNDHHSLEKLKLFKDMFSDYIDQTILINMLTANDTTRLTNYLLGLTTPAALSEFIFRISMGNPFAIEECIRSIVTKGVLAPSWGKWELDEQSLTDMKLPENVVDLVGYRLKTLSGNAQSVLAVASCIGHEFSQKLIAEVLDTTTADIESSLAEAEQKLFISRITTDLKRFVHDRIMEAAQTLIDPDRICRIHAKIRDWLLNRKIGDQESWSRVASHQVLSKEDSDPQKVAEIYLNAANESFARLALDEAYRYFVFYEKICEQHTMLRYQPSLNFAVVCDRLGKKNEATTRYSQSLEYEPNPIRKSIIHGLMSRNHVENLETTKGKNAIDLGFKALKMSVPTVKRHLIASIINAAWSEIIFRTGIGYSTCPPKKRTRYEAIVALHEQTAFLKFFQIEAVAGIVATLRALPYGVRLGPSRLLATLYSTSAIFFGLARMRRTVESFCSRALSQAIALNDPQLVARIKAYHAFAVNYTGEAKEAEARYYQILIDYKEVISAENYSYVTGSIMAIKMDSGDMKETLRVALTGIDHLTFKTPGEKQRGHYSTWSYSFAMWALVSLGRNSEANAFKEKIDRYFDDHIDDAFHLAVHLMNMMHMYVEIGESGQKVEELIANHDKLNIVIPTSIMQIRHFYTAKAQYRFEQWRKSTNTDQERSNALLLKKAMFQLKLCCHTDLFSSHYDAIKGSIHSHKGNHKKAEHYLNRAEHLARRSGNFSAIYKIHLARARQFNKQGLRSAAVEICLSLQDMCARHEWIHRSRQIKDEFGIGISTSKSDQYASGNSSSTRTLHSQASVALAIAKKSREALIRVSLAASESIDTEKLVNKALTEILDIMGGERVALLLYNKEDNQLKFYAGKSSNGESFFRLEGYSTSVVDKVWIDKSALIVSAGSGANLESAQSIVANDLRSIVASPVIVKGNQLGVVYLDSSILKGIFSPDDVEILTSIATQIGIGIEAAKTASMEIEKKNLERDLEISGTVQKLLIPSSMELKTSEFHLAASYVPANKAGGDWIWYEPTSEGKMRVYLADVTGHGPGPAIMTGVAAGAHHILRKLNLPLEAQVEQMQNVIVHFGRDVLFMIFAAFEFDSHRNIVTIVNAGFPAIAYNEGTNKNASRIQLSSNPLGLQPMRLSTKEIAFPSGSRMIVSTDGAYEFLNRRKQQFGIRGLIREFTKVSDLPIKEALTSIEVAIEMESEKTIEDDRTMILVDRL
jgi:serine phosphatase RsbU (regulator of sigma subunit)/tRNA A-37 threonylcarbamoyl transferase component Bud32/tetratricopeptide (TPR) repeat protein